MLRRKAEYKKYLKSPQWKALRRNVLDRDNGRCTQCRGTQRLHVHHLHYSTFESEDLDDLVTLCEDCHNVLHGGSPRRTKGKKRPPAKFTNQEKRKAREENTQLVKNIDKTTRALIRNAMAAAIK